MKGIEMAEQKKLKWERIGDSHDLRLVNVADANRSEIKKLLQQVEKDDPDFAIPFSRNASTLFRKWLDELRHDPERNRLTEKACSLLNNWFLGEGPAREKTRALHAGKLWDVLFCARPDERWTDWRISEEKVAPDKMAVWDKWWKKQQECQKDC